MRTPVWWSFGRFVLPAVGAMVALLVPGVARADYVYTFSSTGSQEPLGSAQFDVTSILTASTTISTFTSETFSTAILDSISIAPEPGQDCGIANAGRCIAVTFGLGATYFYYFNSDLTSTGTFDTYMTNGNVGSLQISQVAATPEPNSLLLIAGALPAVWLARKRLFARGSQQ